MEEQDIQTTNPVNNTAVNTQPVNNPVASSSGNKFLLVGLGVLFLLVILLVIIISGVFKSSNPKVTGTVQQTVVPRVTAPDISQPQQQDISQQPITSQQDTLKALQEIDSANPDAVGADLDLNTQDASSFSQ
ncbi:MAG: hypothetical protein M1372_02415 [Patescibacteria group bacterium]|nr:hypothetical protein [Patescibacteria group bacterium]